MTDTSHLEFSPSNLRKLLASLWNTSETKRYGTGFLNLLFSNSESEIPIRTPTVAVVP